MMMMMMMMLMMIDDDCKAQKTQLIISGSTSLSAEIACWARSLARSRTIFCLPAPCPSTYHGSNLMPPVDQINFTWFIQGNKQVPRLLLLCVTIHCNLDLAAITSPWKLPTVISLSLSANSTTCTFQDGLCNFLLQSSIKNYFKTRLTYNCAHLRVTN